MIAYLDASVLVPLIASDRHTLRAKELLTTHEPTIVVSDFAATEFASAIARRVRMRELTRGEGEGAFLTFDAWMARAAVMVETASSDIAVAGTYFASSRSDAPSAGRHQHRARSETRSDAVHL